MSIADQAQLEADSGVSSKVKAKLVLSSIEDAKSRFHDYNSICDGIDKRYADLSKLANKGDAEFNLFWSNIQVMGPSIYARPPVPVVTPRFNDRRPLYRTSAELLERCAVVDFDRSQINSVMIDIRDDLIINSRGAAWVRYESAEESETKSERVVADWLYRRDFLHGPARTWANVPWVARRAWLSVDDFSDRFDVTLDEAREFVRVTKPKWEADKWENYVDDGLIGVWEYWDKQDKKVYWAVEGHEDLLDEDDPHLTLDGFFPCPQPAYATVEHNTLMPVPEFLLYADQLDEIDRLTNQIQTLAQNLKVVGWYPGGQANISDAIQQAIETHTDGQVVFPIADWAAVASAGGKLIEWFPTDMTVATLMQAVQARAELIENVYQIMGLSDIMRGSSNANETATAQQLKAQSASVRIRDKVSEMVRIARDIIAIAGEVMAEEFSTETLAEMSQMQLPTDAEIKRQMREIERQARDGLEQLEAQVSGAVEGIDQASQEQVAQIEMQVQQAMADPQAQEIIQQQGPALQQQIEQQVQQIQQSAEQQKQQIAEQVSGQQQQIIAETQQQMSKLEAVVTIDAVAKFLRDEKLRPYILDIESDSTIYANEMAEKESRAEFLAVFGSAMQQLSAMIATEPSTAAFAGEILRFAIAPYRAGRALDASIDTFVEQLEGRANQPQGDPQGDALQAQMELAQQRLQIEMQKAEVQTMKVQADIEAKQAEIQIKMQDAQLKSEQAQASVMSDQAKQASEIEETQAELQKTMAEIEKIMAEIEKIRADTDRSMVETELAQRNSDIEGARALNDIANSSAQTVNTIRQSETTVTGQTNGR